MPFTLKDDLIKNARKMLAEIPFNNIYSYADNLFDLPEMFIGDPALNHQVNFLKNTCLKDLSFENTDPENSKFILKNNITEEFIEVSNRASSRNEIRGEILRNILNKEKAINPVQNVFDVISKAIKDPIFSDMLVMLKGTVTGKNAELLYNEPMEGMHFDIFARMLLDAINKKIKTGAIAENLQPMNIRDNKELRDQIWEDIDIDTIYEISKRATMDFTKHLNALQSKAVHLKKRRYHDAAEIADTLVQNLMQEKNDYLEGKQTINQFFSNSYSLLKTAEKNDLINPGELNIVLSFILNSLLAIITLGSVNIATGKFNIVGKNDTLDKIKSMKSAIKNLKPEMKSGVDEQEKPKDDNACKF